MAGVSESFNGRGECGNARVDLPAWGFVACCVAAGLSGIAGYQASCALVPVVTDPGCHAACQRHRQPLEPDQHKKDGLQQPPRQPLRAVYRLPTARVLAELRVPVPSFDSLPYPHLVDGTPRREGSP